MVTALVAGDVQYTDYLALIVEYRCSGACQEMIRAQVMFAGMYYRRRLLRDRGTDGIGPFAFFRPRDARIERNPIRLFEKIIVAQRMHDQAVRIRQEYQ